MSRILVLALLCWACSTPEAIARPGLPREAPAAASVALPDASVAPTPSAVPALPADDAMPPVSPGELAERGRHLLEAIAQDRPELAQDLLFPRDAFTTTRDAQDPVRAWEKTVHAPFVRSVHQLHKRLRGLPGARVAGFELGQSVVQMRPQKREWKRPLWRVRHSKITVVADGHTKRLDLPELTSWRGAWYVTKLR